jgi:hypothetical protein|tara:strand:+ start:1371 stop:1784 length:414 start_codon:yes stop_codon:yes gene_type:complete
MAKSNAFKLAELIRVFQYNTVSDEIETEKKTKDKNKKSGDTTKTATTEFNLDTFAHASFRAARYIVAMSEGSDFHSTEIMLIHDGSSVTLTSYGTLKSSSALATFDADISGGNLQLKCTPASSSSTTIKFDRIVIDA